MWSFFSKDPSRELVNFELQEQIALESELEEKTIWNLNNAKKKGSTANPSTQQSGELFYSCFSYIMKPGNESWLQSAKNSFKRMKMLRHPNILMFQDGVETEKSVFIVTERVQPLLNYLRESKENDSQKENEISWGLHQIATALSFINNDCKLVHNNVCMASIVVTRAGEWKLTGFEYSHAIDDRQIPYKVLPTLDRYDPPEKSPINNLNTPQTRNSNIIPTESSVDSWGFGCLIWEIFNGLLPNMNALKNPGKIPKRLVSVYMELINTQANKRLNPLTLIKSDRLNNEFVDTLLFLEQIQIKDQAEKTKYFTELTQKLDDFPNQLCLFKILPQLITAFEFGNAGSSVLPPLFKLGKLLDENEYQKKIVPVVVKLFSSTDRATRMRLLQQLHLFVEHLSAAIINDQIFPNICQGFSDTNPAIRESTIRSVVLIAPKLNYNNLNVELMKHFARLQGQDEQGMIRTNTTVCIGKIANYINPQLRQRILLSAFPKAMRDPYPLARLSGIVAFANTDSYYTLRDIASKVLPSLCMLTIDPEKDVRDEAFKTIKLYSQKLEKVSENPELALEMEKDVMACNLDVKNETSWTSWAMTSLSAKMSGYKNKNQQPSVALNTQPLNQPTTINLQQCSTSNIKEKSPENNPNKKEDKINKTPKTEVITSSSQSNFASGWNTDDNEWKDLDDDDNMMEPLEPLEPTKSKVEISNTKQSENNKKLNQSDEWSNWTNSFDDFKNNTSFEQPNDDIMSSFDTSANASSKGLNKQKSNQTKANSNSLNAKVSNNSQTQLPPASSYNWTTTNQNNSSALFPDPIKNEEDLFSSLVKDISIKNSKSFNSTEKQVKSSINDKTSGNLSSSSSTSGWADDWSDVFDNSNKDSKKLNLQQRNAEKQLENEAKLKQSKPMKLGQKKTDFFA